MKNLVKNLGFMFLALVAIVMISLPANAAAVINTPPVIDAIGITPESPTKYQELTCSVSVSDTDGNLDYVEFNWYRNGQLLRQTNKLVYGSTSSAYDVFTSPKEANDYVVCEAKAYDFEGAYDRETHAVRVGNMVSNSAPSVSYVDITPRHPNPQQDLTCSVFATDADDNLGYVVIEWYRNDRLIRSVSKTLEGSSDTSYDTLRYGYASAGDLFKCKVKVYDAAGQSAVEDSMPVVISGSTQSTTTSSTVYLATYTPYSQRPVAALFVNDRYPDEDENMQFSGYSSYDPDGGSITQYLFDFGDGSQSAWQPASTPFAYHAYSNDGIYYARLMVKDDEQQESLWSTAVVVYVGNGNNGNNDDEKPQIDDIGITKEAGNNYVRFTCKVEAFDHNGDLSYVRFKWYQNDELTFTYKQDLTGDSDDASTDIDILANAEDTIKCEVTVYDEEHNYVTSSRSTSGEATQGTGCSIIFDRFDYNTYMMEGNNGWVESEIENTGGLSGTLYFKLYVDKVFKDQYSVHLSAGDSAVKRFEFPLSVGAHKATVEVYLSCSGKLNKTAEITIFPATSSVFVPTGGSGGSGTVTPATGETTVNITPASIDIELNTGKTVAIDIYSPNQAKFTIAVDGLPDGWANYPNEIEMKGTQTVYAYIVPKSLGNYEFKVKVMTGSKTFEQTIKLYVAPSAQSNNQNGLTGMINALEGNWLIGAALIAILAVLVALYFFAGRFKKKTYEEHVYGTPYETYHKPFAYYDAQNTRMMKGSVGNMAAVEENARAADATIARMLPAEILKYHDGTSYPKIGKDFTPI